MIWIEKTFFILFAIILLITFMEIVLRYFWRRKESRALYYNQSNIISESFENLSQETFPIFAELTKTAQAPIIGWTLIPNYKNKIYQSDKYGFRNTHNNFSSKITDETKT